MDWAEKRGWDDSRKGNQYARQSVLVVHSGLAILSGLAAAANSGGWEAVKQCIDFGLFMKFLPVSLCFATGLSLKMMAVDHFQAGTIKIVGQMRLPAIALLSALLLGRRYSPAQWQVIALISTSCIAFVLLKGQGRRNEGKSWKWVGLSQLFSWVVLNCVGGIIAEHSYKAKGVPFYQQKVAEDVGHLLMSLLMLYVIVPHFQPSENVLDRKMRPGGLFDSWDIRTVVVCLFLFVDAWVGNMLLKEFSGLARSIAKAFSIAAVYLVSLLYSKDRRSNPTLTLVAFMVVQTSVLFAFSS